MKYEQLSPGSSCPYPDHNIDPKEKDEKWGCTYAKAAYYDWSYNVPKGVFNNNNGAYQQNRLYGTGKQPISPYKTMLGVDQQTNNTWLTVDWSIRPIAPTYIDKIIARLVERDHSIVATPMDMLAKSEEQQYYAEMKAKMALRAVLQQNGASPDLQNHPFVAIKNGDPMDPEELDMRMQMGEQFNRSMDAEMAISIGFNENEYEQKRQEWLRDLVFNGVAGYKHELGDDNKAKVTKVDPEAVVVSTFKDAYGARDAMHIGEVIDVSLIDLASKKDDQGNSLFSDDQLQEFAASIVGKWSNPTSLNRGTYVTKPFDKFKCKVLDLEFFSYDEYVYQSSPDKNGNPDFRRADYNRGRKSDKYMRKRYKMVYKVKWVVGTDYCYDFGLASDMVRTVDPKKKADTSLSYKLFAVNFYDMRAQGMVERLIPYIDAYQLIMLKIDNFRNRSVPSGWWIDLDGLERAALTKDGKKLSPLELIKMFMESGVLVGRSINPDGSPAYQNSLPVIPLNNTAASELQMFYEELVQILGAMDRITGANDITNGDPNPKTLVPGYQMANQSTNHALAAYAYAEKCLTESLANDVLSRMQQGVRKGPVSGYGRALNANVLQFMKISPAIGARDFGIKLEEKTTDEQKMWILQNVNQDIANGYLDTSDAILIINTHNAKQAMVILSYKVKKAKEAMNQQKMQEQQMQNDGNAQAAKVASDERMQIANMQIQADLQKAQYLANIDMQKEQMRIDAETNLKLQIAQMEYQKNSESNMTKIAVQEKANEGKIVAQHISSEGDKDKQHIANQKPPTAAK